ncbi:MAG: ornithine cyclodeaminase [Butyrivibrio sp.]|uniref:ornithine cyclodeaminase n=1 Tax=Butyrivibrio sp. TaxID=28121 RepID=UPI0025C0AB58|nr:ornithine cyclodeaminase [Butyrivibrio sp.]MBQ6588726.1 ornithine cyclodeaminase [Butyrivibrio sp.]
MKIISFEDIKNMKLEPSLCYEWVSDMIADKGKTQLPPKTHMTLPGNIFCNVMPSMIEASMGIIGGVKVVTRYPERKPSLDSKILLFDGDSGEFLALMDGNWITAMRTGAVAAHSVMHLAKAGFKTLGLIGLGNVTRSTMIVLASLCSDRKLTVKLLRYKDQAESFMERFKDFDNLDFVIVDTVRECIQGSEVVISGATYFENDIAEDEWFDEGVLVVPVHTRGFTNCDLFFDKVFADDTGHVDHFGNFSKFKYYAEVSDVVNGRAEGRTNDKERILAYNIGVSIHDINYAALIYQLMSEDKEVFGSLADAEMKEPSEKFWI